MRTRTWLSLALVSLSLVLAVTWKEVQAGPETPRSFALVSGLGDDAVTVVDPSTCKVVRVMPVHDQEDVAEVISARQERRLYVLDEGSRIRCMGPRSQMVYATWTLPRRPLPADQPALALSADERWLFVRSGSPIVAPGTRGPASSSWALDVHASRWVPVQTGTTAGLPPRIVTASHGRMLAVSARAAVELRLDGPMFRPGRRVPLPFSSLDGAIPAPDGQAFYAVGAITRRNSCHLVAWNSQERTPRRINLGSHLSTPSSESARPLLSASPDGQWLVVARDHWVLFVRPQTLTIEDRIWLDGTALAMAFTLDSQHLLVLMDQGRLVRVRAGDRHLSPVADGLLRRDAGARLTIMPAAW